MTELAENDDRSEGKIGKDSWIDGVSSGNIDAATPRADRGLCSMGTEWQDRVVVRSAGST